MDHQHTSHTCSLELELEYVSGTIRLLVGVPQTQPLISVIAPCLNEEKYIKTFLESLTKQTLPKTLFEVVIVDGGSTDHTLQIILSYTHKLSITLLTDKTRNFGYIRNVGARNARGRFHFQCNTDNYLPPNLLEEVIIFYKKHRFTLSMSGRVHPMGTSIIAFMGYAAFDLLRFLFTVAPWPIKKYRPSGSFTTIRGFVWKNVGGYPEVTVNEDGLFGQKLDHLVTRYHHKAVAFNLKLHVGHYVKKFEEWGGIHALLFYLYTLGNFAPILKPLLEPIRRSAGDVFSGGEYRKRGLRETLTAFWNWL